MTTASITPRHAAPGDASGSVLLRQMEHLGRQLAGADPTQGSPAQAITTIGRLQAMLTAYQGRLLRANGKEAADRAGAGNPAQWVAGQTRQDTRDAAKQTQRADALARAAATEHALGAGEISAKHADVITGALTQLPDSVTAEQRKVVELALVKRAREIDPTHLRREAKRALAAVEPDPHVVDAHEDALLTAEEDAALAATWMTLFDLADGTTIGHFCIPTLYAHMLRKVIHAMASPRRHPHGRRGDDRAGRARDWRDAHGSTPGYGSNPVRPGQAASVQPTGTHRDSATGPEPQERHDDVPPAVDFDAVPSVHDRPAPRTDKCSDNAGATSGGSCTGPAPPDKDGMSAAGQPGGAGAQDAWEGLSWKQRYGRAFVDVLGHLPTDHLHPKTAATIVVHLSHRALRDQVAAAVGTDTAHRMSAATLRRTACSAGILPAVYSGASVPVDLGRTSRLFTPAQRLLLAEYYPTCAAEGCDRPFAWTEIHHLQAWTPTRDEPGGATDLNNALPLCGHHHRLIHHPRYAHTLTRADSARPSPFIGSTTGSGSTAGTGPPRYTVTYRTRT